MRVGELELDILHVPGHTPGHLVYVYKPANLALVGDTLFRGSVGGRIFPMAIPSSCLKASAPAAAAGDSMVCLPGHGPLTSIGDERTQNPFLQR